MNSHFEVGLGVKKIIEDFKPKVVLELGAAGGVNTRKLLSMDSFDLISISDSDLDMYHPRLTFIRGVSYIEIPKLLETIDIAIIDTDHNYWNTMKELDVLLPKMADKCIIMAHDTVAFGIKDGKAPIGTKLYSDNKTPYPMEEIVACGQSNQGVWNAMTNFAKDKGFTVIGEVKILCGAMAIGRGL